MSSVKGDGSDYGDLHVCTSIPGESFVIARNVREIHGTRTSYRPPMGRRFTTPALTRFPLSASLTPPSVSNLELIHRFSEKSSTHGCPLGLARPATTTLTEQRTRQCQGYHNTTSPQHLCDGTRERRPNGWVAATALSVRREAILKKKNDRIRST